MSGKHGSFGAGAMLEAVEGSLWLAGSYQAQPALGPMQLKGTLTPVYLGERAPFPVTFHQALPDIGRLGARYRPVPTLELRVFGELTRWSVLQTQCLAYEKYGCVVDSTGANAGPDAGVLQNLRRRWKDSYSGRAGLSYRLSPAVEIYTGGGYETGAVPDSTLDPRAGRLGQRGRGPGGTIPDRALAVHGRHLHSHPVPRSR